MNDGNFYYSDFIKRGSKPVGTENGYIVVASQRYKMGQIIEECVTKPISSTLESFYSDDSPKDNRLLDGLVHNHNPVTGISSLSMVGGNFALYRFYPDNNAVYQHDPRFGVVTIRAIKDIEVGEEITFYPILPEEKETSMPRKIEKKGCGCGKKRTSGETPESLPNPTFGAPKILRDKKNDPVKRGEFKSMVNNKELDSIKVDK